jgi:hypothetical protein
MTSQLGRPAEKKIRNDGAIPWASQIVNDSDAPGLTVQAALNNNKRLRAIAEDLDLQTLNDEVSVALGGIAGDEWVPTMAIVDITAITGAANGDAEITIGTSAGGTQILAATALTATNADGEKFAIDLTGVVKASIAANATIYVKCTTADTGAGTVLTANIYLIGEIL